MSLTNTLVCLHLLVVFAALLSVGLRFLTKRRWLPLHADGELQLNYWLLSLTLVLPAMAFWGSQAGQFEPWVRTYTAQTWQQFDQAALTQVSTPKIEIGALAPQGVAVHWIGQASTIFLLLSLILSLGPVFKELWQLHRLLRSSHLLRRQGQVRVVCSDEITVPFSFLTFSHAWVVIPATLLSDSGRTRMSIAHELQHHRQRDTLWQYAVIALKAFTSINPATGVFTRLLSETQELTVDRALVDQGKVHVGDYARCLLAFATTASLSERKPVCATGLVFLTDRHQLTRRLQEMFQAQKNARWSVPALAVALTVFMSTLAFKAGHAIGGTGLTMEEAQALVVNTPSTYPLHMNEKVLRQLNRYIGTQEGRAYMRSALRRMEQYRPMIEEKTKEYGVPAELIVIPIVESGFQNLPQKPTGGLGAGLWQFIPGTARAYGLRVWQGVDERLDVAKETDAAMRLLKAERIRFGRWPLSLLAYNAGDSLVTRGIFQTGSHNVWDLLNAGFEGDKQYMPKITAAILIMKHPELLD